MAREWPRAPAPRPAPDSPFYDAWLELPTWRLLAEGSVYWAALRVMVSDGRVTGAQVHNVRVAALCRQHGVRELWSADRDFSRFTGFAVVNPLIGGESFHAN